MSTCKAILKLISKLELAARNAAIRVDEATGVTLASLHTGATLSPTVWLLAQRSNIMWHLQSTLEDVCIWLYEHSHTKAELRLHEVMAHLDMLARLRNFAR
jgi:hypothetical protein